MNNEELQKLKRIYGRLIGFRNSLPREYIKKSIADDFERMLNDINLITQEDFSSFKLPNDACWQSGSSPNTYYCDGEIVRSKAEQFISYLEYSYTLGEKVAKIGSLIGTIQDQEIRARCLDLLSASGKFDRVINQATLILEDRIKKKSMVSEKLKGVNLVNKVLNPDLTKTILKVSDEPDEQQGFCDVCRGIMLAFRNPTHHQLTDKFTREDALKFCGFIDVLLSMLDKAKK